MKCNPSCNPGHLFALTASVLGDPIRAPTSPASFLRPFISLSCSQIHSQSLPERGFASFSGPEDDTCGSSFGPSSHIPLSRFQKSALAVMASIGAALDPRRADLVAIVGETTGVLSFRSIRDRLRASEEGRRLLAERPRVTDASVARAWDLPESTFGGAYARFMESRGFRADERPPVRFVDDPELAWVATRCREVHDFWHVLFGCHTNVFGEVALKAVEFMQTGIPMTGMAVIAGMARLKAKDREVMRTRYLPWAIRAGSKSADLMTLFYEQYFEEDLKALRDAWRIEPAPRDAVQNRPRVVT